MGVIEFFAPRIPAPDAQITATFATVGGQLAQYFERRRLQADESRRVEAMLRAERDRAQRYLDVAGTVIVVLDLDGRGPAHQPQGLLGHAAGGSPSCSARDWFELAVPEPRARRGARLLRPLHAAARSRRSTTTRARSRSRAAARGSSPGTASSCATPRARPIGTLSSGEDVTERRQAEQQITYLAYHDQLTGLPNRSLLEEHLKLALARSRRTGSGRRAAAPRARRLQARQRLARPRRRRRAAVPARGAPAGVRPHDGPARPHGRRRVPAPARRPPGRPDGGRRARGRPAHRPRWPSPS